MKNTISITLFLAVIFSAFLFSAACSSQKSVLEKPDKTLVLDAATRVNDWFMAKYADPTQTSHVGKIRPSNIWTRGVYYEGLMALHKANPEQRYIDYALRWAEFHKWGLNGGIGTRDADNQCCGQTYIDLYNLSPSPEKIRDIKACLNLVVERPENGDWTWIDAIQMAMPAMAKLGRLTGDSRYYEKMYQMYSHTRNIQGGGLWCAGEGLWWRDADFVPPYREPNGKNCFWSRGNGWVYAALARVLETIPADEPHRAEYLADYLAMTKAIIKCQRSDGFWNASLHDESNFGGKETSGTSLFVYGLAWGINNGLLEAKNCLPTLLLAWNGLTKDAVHPDGFLGYVQGTGKEPKDGQPIAYDHSPDFEDFGVGCFLLAASEVSKIR
jgi:rhamnogalacturonyl hydrolase YesR